eukprot:TRINITY_DN26956_c0_g1_i3.p3 TRINITY_DN26956_c0_g1~~TRINITY_DN26956_c0_g1_i3.p3  ORF type:complete len:370 (-),score=27.79 TRINITY_DN26956_c0_g1_i3:1036-2145(-)
MFFVQSIRVGTKIVWLYFLLCIILFMFLLHNLNSNSTGTLGIGFQKNRQCSPSLEMLQFQMPSLHGKVEKRGILPLNLWLTSTRNVYVQQLNQYLEGKKMVYNNGSLMINGETAPQKLIRPPISAPCQVYVNHQHKFIFVKNTKVAGTSFFQYFGWICKEDGSPPGRKGLHKTCFQEATLENFPLEKASQIWQEYTVFATSRNPFIRAPSAYHYLQVLRDFKNKTENRDCSKPSFEQFSRYPFIVGLQSMQQNCTKDHQHDFKHVEPQAQCLKTLQGLPAVDFVVSLENLNDEFKELTEILVEKSGVPKNETFLKDELVHIQVGPESNANSSYALKLYKQCGNKCLEWLAEYYADDFQFFGYPNCVRQL